MATTIFVDGQTVIPAAWLNDVNAAVYTPGAVVATSVVNTPAGNIAATNVQAALNELDTEKIATTAIGVSVQAYDATTTALAGLDTTTGLVEQTGPDAFTKRALAASETVASLSRRATTAEAVAGEEDTAHMTSLKVRQARRILQVVHFDTGAVATGTTVIPLDDTIPQNTEGDQYMSLEITPLAATSTLRVDVTFFANSSVAAWMMGALFRDAGVNSIGVSSVYNSSVGAGITTSFSAKVTSGSTAPTTFNFRAGAHSAGTTTFNGQAGARLFGGAIASSIRITEIAA